MFAINARMNVVIRCFYVKIQEKISLLELFALFMNGIPTSTYRKPSPTYCYDVGQIRVFFR